MAFERRILTVYDAATSGFDRGTARVEAGLRRLERTTNQRLTSIDQRFARSSRAALRLGTALVGVLGVAGGAAALRGVRGYAEAWRDVERSLTAAGFAIEGNREKLARLALRTRGDFQTVSGAVSRFARVTGDDLDTSIRRVETLNKLLAIGGATTAERGSATLQLTQGLRSGRLGGEELRSISENAPTEFLDALARRAGATRAELKELGAEGKLTADVITGALDDLAASADAQFARLAVSGTEAASILATGFTTFFGRVDEQIGASAGLNEFLVETGTLLSEDAEAAATFAKALEVAAVAAASLAGGSALGAVKRSLAAGSALRKQAVADSTRLVATTTAEVQKARELVVARGQAFAITQRTATTTKQLETARNSLVAANTRLATAEARAAAATNALTIAQGQLSRATRATGAAMNFLRGTLAFFGGVPGLITAAALAAVYFTGVLEDQGDRLDNLSSKLDSVENGLSRVQQIERDLANDTEALTRLNGQLETAIESQSGAAIDTARIEINAINQRIAKNRELKAEYQALISAQLSLTQGQIISERAAFQRDFGGTGETRGQLIASGEIGEGLAGTIGRDSRLVAEEQARNIARLENEIADAIAKENTLTEEQNEFLERRVQLRELDLRLASLQSADTALTADPTVAPAGGTSSGGGGGGSARAAASLRDLIAASQERQAQLQGEIALERVANEERVFAEEKLRLLTEAARDGIEVGAAELAIIDQNARAYATLSQELSDVQAAKEIITAVTEKQATVEERILAANERLAALLPTIISLVGDEAEARRILTQAMEDSEERIRESADANDEWADSLSRAIEDAKSFEDALKSLGEELLRLAANDFFRSLFKAPNGGNSIFSQLGTAIGNFLGGQFGGGAAPSSSPLPIPKPAFHRGGIVGRHKQTRNVSDAAFIGAPRYHSGGIAGLAPNEVPAILERGEIVVPKGSQLGGGGIGSVTINSPVTITEPNMSRAELAGVLAANRQQTIRELTQIHSLNAKFLQE